MRWGTTSASSTSEPGRRGDRRVTSPSDLERDLLVLACAVSAGIHAALVPEHLEEGTGAGLGFLAAAIGLAVLAIALTRRPHSTGALGAAGALLTGLLVSYALAITSGVPVLHPQPEPVDELALVTKGVELAGLLAAMHLLLRERTALALFSPRTKGTTT